jgi:hypothetical protein
MHRELLGASLPGSAAGWGFAFFAVLGSVAVALTAIEQFFQLFADRDPRFRPLSGLALPVGWVVWSAALLCWKIDTATVLSALLGLFAIVAAMAILARIRK